MNCQVANPDGRIRRFDVTAATTRAAKSVDVEMAAPATPLPPQPVTESSRPSDGRRRAREVCISTTIVLSILTVIGVVVYVF